MKKVSIRESGIDGKGIYANRDILEGEEILPLKGQIVHKNINSKKDSKSTEHWITTNKENTWFNPGKKNEFRYLNHSCNPNATITDNLIMIATRRIKKGEEITMDYGINEVDDHFWAMKCKCGEDDCRHIIRSVIHIPPEIFIKQFSHASEYSQRAYIRHHITKSSRQRKFSRK